MHTRRDACSQNSTARLRAAKCQVRLGLALYSGVGVQACACGQGECRNTRYSKVLQKIELQLFLNWPWPYAFAAKHFVRHCVFLFEHSANAGRPICTGKFCEGCK